jgi:hypothetical protein
MGMSIVCDAVNGIFNALQSILDAAYAFANLVFGIPVPNITEQLGIGSVFGCNLS